MQHFLRSLFPYLAGLFAIGILAWAVSWGTLPPADFVFNNEDEVKSVDPSKATGVPEHRVLSCLFEGLLRLMPAKTPPDKNGVVPLEVVPGVAELPEISPNGRTYTFKLRTNAKWSNGDPVTAHDFVWAWRRTLHPETASEYAYQLHYLKGARSYQQAQVAVGDQVEVEIADRRDENQPFPRGTIVRGVLRDIVKPKTVRPGSGSVGESSGDDNTGGEPEWIYVVEVKSRGVDGEYATDWQAAGPLAAFSPSPPAGIWQHASTPEKEAFRGTVERCHNVLPDFDTTVGAKATDDHTLVVTLHSPTPFFSELTTFYPLSPLHRDCVERYSTAWTKPENMVCNGPYSLHSRRIRDRIRFVKNPHYWDREHVQLRVVDALPLKSRLTGLNMFLNGELDWNHAPPGNMIPYLKDRPDYISGPGLMTYFYRLNVEREGLRDKRVRQALNLALDKKSICTHVTQAGETPARSVVPPGMPGYAPALCGEFNPERARALLAEAGFPDGRGFPKLEILYNSDEMHKAIAEVIQQQWKQTLGINIALHGIAWPAYIEQMLKVDFDICRAGWYPDYSDPNTFLDMFITGGLQNSTHWGSPEYDRLIAAAGRESNSSARLQHLRDAEAILMDELPILPIYYYVTKSQVKPRVRGFHPNLQDFNPIYALSVSDANNSDTSKDPRGS